MDKAKTLDHLYTIRWCLNNDKLEGAKLEVTALIDKLVGESTHAEEPPATDPKDPGTPNDGDPITATLCVVVGHEKKAPGADFALGGSEYQYNSDIAQKMKEYAARKYPTLRVEVIYRDGIGISGAYHKAAALKPDACLELHFNAFNGHAQGSETLCSVELLDRQYAAVVHGKICEAFSRAGQSRGVKPISRSARGGQSVYSLPGSANCLVEPFFGDNPAEAKMADERRIVYAMALLEGTVEWLKAHNLV